jgi:hypothetical protein
VTERKTLLLKLAFGLGRDTVLSIDIDIEIESISLQKTPPRFFWEGKKFVSFSLSGISFESGDHHPLSPIRQIPSVSSQFCGAFVSLLFFSSL